MISYILIFLLAVCCGLGVGSAGILVSYLVVFLDMPQTDAQGYNLIFFLFASVFAVLVHMKKRKLSGIPIFLMIGGGLVGIYPGILALQILPESVLRKIFGGMLLVSGIVGLLRRSKSTEPSEKSRQKIRRNS